MERASHCGGHAFDCPAIGSGAGLLAGVLAATTVKNPARSSRFRTCTIWRAAPEASQEGLLGHAAYGSGCAGEQDRRGTLELFSRTDLRATRPATRQVPLHARSVAPAEADVVVPSTTVVVGFGEQTASERGRHQGTEMQRFGVGDDAIEIEDDRPDHRFFFDAFGRGWRSSADFHEAERTYPFRVK
jgi:hypothetical protein